MGSPSKLYDHTNPDWISTVKMGHLQHKLPTAASRCERFDRNVQRVAKKKKQEAAATLIDFQNKLIKLKRSALGKFQQMILSLMRLRLNMPVSLLSHIFRVSPSTVSKVYSCTVDAMYVYLRHMIHWPEREDLRKTMPMAFRKHYQTKVAVIIDCFEIFIERLSGLKARAQTWSSYKHSNTVKYLIGITPQGVISYISEGWGGRVSDKYLTEHSDFLDCLLPGDVVLAVRGFDIADSIGSVCAQLQIPAFTKGKCQLSANEVESTRKIANV
ncbi:uncharacterized protein LOC117113201 [Anneissia japonica]|uniref:uncharacterized protein LOC117113201 n=1 Tax=Anneissia japonica TaxID=1529436 RepID=UPI0014257E3B|nr:uncharacterized protein LOC117113201 [Anneissia japonica]